MKINEERASNFLKAVADGNWWDVLTQDDMLDLLEDRVAALKAAHAIVAAFGVDMDDEIIEGVFGADMLAALKATRAVVGPLTTTERAEK